MQQLNGEGYIKAKQSPDKKSWKLFYIGTSNEVFPGELFRTAQEARQYWRVMKLKGKV